MAIRTVPLFIVRTFRFTGPEKVNAPPPSSHRQSCEISLASPGALCILCERTDAESHFKDCMGCLALQQMSSQNLKGLSNNKQRRLEPMGSARINAAVPHGSPSVRNMHHMRTRDSRVLGSCLVMTMSLSASSVFRRPRNSSRID